MTVPAPVDIKLHRQSRILEIGFEDGSRFELPCELLRVYSPSAEVRGHGPGQEILQIGKEQVNVDAIEPIGNYAVRLRFSDGHETGIYTWDLLHDLGTHREQLWANYLEKLASAGHTRPPPDKASSR